MKLKPQTVIATAAGIVLAGIALSAALGLWTTQSDKIPQKYRQEDLAGTYNPADIRGSYTFGEISDLFGVPLEDLAQAFQVKEGQARDFACKELETALAGSAREVGTGSVRLFTALYLGLPFEESEEIWLPESAAALLREKAPLESEDLNWLEEHTVP